MNKVTITLDDNFIQHVKSINSIDTQPLKAVIYTRVSTEMQPQSALDSQEAVACEFAKCNNIDIIKVFSDKGISGTTDNRPNFQEMIKYVENQNNDIQLIIVYKLDRLFRQEQLFNVYEYRLNKCGVFVLSATEETYKNDIGSRVLKAVTLINNEFEANKIRENVKRGQTYTAKQGKTNGGIAPLGYDINADGKYVVNPEEAKIVKKIFEMKSNGVTYEQMADTLNKQNYRTKIGRKFTKNNFHEILTNPKYKGVFVYNRSAPATEYNKSPNRHKYKSADNIITVKGKIERIVSESLWDSVQPKKNLSGKTNKGKYLLSGLVKCPICHNSYHVDTKGNVQYLRHNKNKTDKCINSIPMDNVKEKVILKVINKIFSKYNVEYFTNNFDTISQTQTASIEQHIKKLKFKINALKVKYDNLLNTLSETTDENIKTSITDKLTSINTEISTYTNSIEKLKNSIPQPPTKDNIRTSKKKLKAFLTNPKNILDSKKLIHSIIDSVYITENDIKVIFKE